MVMTEEEKIIEKALSILESSHHDEYVRAIREAIRETARVCENLIEYESEIPQWFPEAFPKDGQK